MPTNSFMIYANTFRCPCNLLTNGINIDLLLLLQLNKYNSLYRCKSIKKYEMYTYKSNLNKELL